MACAIHSMTLATNRLKRCDLNLTKSEIFKRGDVTEALL